jgi:16S rRNA processing protein RimM
VTPKNPILLAVIGAAHGIKGEVRVKTFTGDPLALGDYGPLHAADGRSFEPVDIRPAGTVVVVRFKGINDRSAVEALTGTELFVDRSALPEGEDDEFYHTDLVGLAVRDETGAEIGKVVAVQNFGADDVLEMTLGGRKGVLIPFSKAAVPEVSLKEGFVRIDSVAAGLVDDENDDDKPDGTKPEMESDPAGSEAKSNRKPRESKNPGGKK